MRARHRTALLLLPLALALLGACVDRELPTAAPFAPAFSTLPSGGPFAYVTNANSNNVSVIHTSDNTVVSTVPVGSIPFGVAITPQAEAGFTFTGFFAPVDNTVVNVAKAGSAIPVKFSLGGEQGLDVFASGSPRSQATACEAGAPEGPIGSTVSAGGSSLSYDTATDIYTYVWKTEKAWGNSCCKLTLVFEDDPTKTPYAAEFRFTK